MDRKGKATSKRRLDRLLSDIVMKRPYKKPNKPPRHRRRNMMRVLVTGTHRHIWLERHVVEKGTPAV